MYVCVPVCVPMETLWSDDLDLITHQLTDNLLPSDNLKPSCQLKKQLLHLIRPLEGISQSFTRVVICGYECGIQCYGIAEHVLKDHPIGHKKQKCGLWRQVVSGDWFSYIDLKGQYRLILSFCQKCVVCQDRWSLKRGFTVYTSTLCLPNRDCVNRWGSHFTVVHTAWVVIWLCSTHCQLQKSWIWAQECDGAKSLMLVNFLLVLLTNWDRHFVANITMITGKYSCQFTGHDLIFWKGVKFGHMLLLKINRTPYMGSPIAPSDSTLKGQTHHSDFDALYLVKVHS